MFNASEGKKGKGRFVNSARAAPRKCADLTIYVLPGPSTLTPKGSRDMELAHAGLGKKVVAVPEDSKHSQVINYDDDAVVFYFDPYCRFHIDFTIYSMSA